MSFLKFLKKKEKMSPLPDAIEKLKENEKMFTKKQQHLEEMVQKQLEEAKKAHRKGNKTLALKALKRKKQYEHQLQTLDGALTKVESQRELLETAHMNAVTLGSMRDAHHAIKSSQKNIDVDQVDKLLDDLDEQKKISQDISEAISHPCDFDSLQIDEEDLEQELENLMRGRTTTESVSNALPTHQLLTTGGEKQEETEVKKKLPAKSGASRAF